MPSLKELRRQREAADDDNFATLYAVFLSVVVTTGCVLVANFSADDAREFARARAAAKVRDHVQRDIDQRLRCVANELRLARMQKPRAPIPPTPPCSMPSFDPGE
jgi:hypothetical protein